MYMHLKNIALLQKQIHVNKYGLMQFKIKTDNCTLLSVDCQWSSWTPSGSCSKSCAGGIQNYTRNKTVSESNGGSCSGLSEKTDSCNTQDCPTGPGKFSYCVHAFESCFIKSNKYVRKYVLSLAVLYWNR